MLNRKLAIIVAFLLFPSWAAAQSASCVEYDVRWVTTNGEIATTGVRLPCGSGATPLSNGAQPFGPLPVGLTNGDFSQGLSGWQTAESGGSAAPGQVTLVGNQAQLDEGDSFLVTLSQTFIVPSFPDTITFELTLLPGFDQTANFIPDAFEVSLLDSSLLPVVTPWTQFASSFFNVQEDGTTNLSPAVTWDGLTATLDISTLAAGDVVTLSFDYINGDTDTTGGVRVGNVVLNDNTPPGAFRRGDLDNDGLVDNTDLADILSFLWDAGSTPIDCLGGALPESADVNDNEFVTIADYLELRNLLGVGGLPAEPTVFCGLDPADDAFGFDAVDVTYTVSVGNITVDPPMASMDRDVFIPIAVDLPTDITGFTVTLEFPEPTLMPFDPSQGDPAPFESALGTVDFLVEPGRITVGVWATNDGDVLLPAGPGTFQDVGEVRFHLADFAILPALTWNPQPNGVEPTLRATIVDTAFVDHHPQFVAGQGVFARGNSNDDANVDIADAVFTLGYLFNSGPTPACLDAADANNDSDVNIADAVYTLGFLFANGPVIPAPYPACGFDVGPIDTLPCGPNVCTP